MLNANCFKTPQDAPGFFGWHQGGYQSRFEVFENITLQNQHYGFVSEAVNIILLGHRVRIA